MKHGNRAFKKKIITGYRWIGSVGNKSYTKSFEFTISVVHSSPDRAAQSDKAIPLEDAIEYAKQQVEQILREKIHRDAGATILIIRKPVTH